MFCNYCGSEVDGNIRFCPNCGHEIGSLNQINNASVDTQDDNNAMIGFILGLISLAVPLTAIPGIVFSAKGLKSEKRKALAGVGLGVSIVTTCITVFIIILYVFIFLFYWGMLY